MKKFKENLKKKFRANIRDCEVEVKKDFTDNYFVIVNGVIEIADDDGNMLMEGNIFMVVDGIYAKIITYGEVFLVCDRAIDVIKKVFSGIFIDNKVEVDCTGDDILRFNDFNWYIKDNVLTY